MNTDAVSPEARKELMRARRAGARLAAVQALYQMEQTEQGSLATIREFMEDRLGLDDDGRPVEEADPDLFKWIVSGVVEHQERIDEAVIARLANGWRLDRIDSTSRAILRSAVYELIFDLNLPSQIIVDEYVSIAHAFFDAPESGFVNGLLDAVARDVRKTG